MDWEGHMRFAQMLCWSWPPGLSGPGPVVLQVRLSPLVVFSQMTRNNCATLGLVLWNRSSSSKACHNPWVTQCSFEKYMKKNWNFSNSAYILGDFPWNWLKCRFPHPDLMYFNLVLHPIILPGRKAVKHLFLLERNCMNAGQVCVGLTLVSLAWHFQKIPL